MGRLRPSRGMKSSPTAARLSARKSQYLKKNSRARLKSTYGIDPADLEDYVCKLPMMSAHITEFFIAKVKDGKMDAVKAALQARQEALAGGFLYPSLVELVEDYKLVVNGNYILFCITENADQAVEIFDDYTK